MSFWGLRRGFFAFRHLHHKMIVLLVFLMFLPTVIVGAVNMIMTSKLMTNQLKHGAEQLFAQTTHQLETLHQNIGTVESLFVKNADFIHDFGLSADRITTEQVDAANRFKASLQNAKYIDENLDITIYVPSEHYLTAYGLPVLLDPGYWKSLEQWQKPRERMFRVVGAGDKRKLQWMTPLDNVNGTKPLGILVIECNYNEIGGILDDGSHKDSIQMSLIDNRNRYLARPSSIEGIGQEAATGSDAGILRYSREIGKDWTLVGEVRQSRVLAPLHRLQTWTGLITLSQILLTIGLAIWLARSFSRPIQLLASLVNKNKRKGAGLVIPRLNRQDEVGFLYAGIRNLLQEIVMEQAQKKEVQLRMLQYQINPHFLYNSLDSIQWKAIEHRDKDLSEMIQNLSYFLRHGLSHGDIVTVEEELKYLKCYTDLQTIRYRDQFRVEVDVPGYLYAQKLIKISIQPLVENAIMHGMSRQGGGSRIRIVGAKIDDRTYMISIIDDGRNLDLKRVEQLMAQPSGPVSAPFGIRNVNERIKLYYGASYGLKASKLDNGTQFDLVLPFE